MKKYLVIGNPVEHSLSPQLHNYWLKKNNIKAIYEKKLIKISEIQEIISQLKKDQINGVNVTIPFKNSVIPFLDDITELAKETQSVNTLYKKKDRVIEFSDKKIREYPGYIDSYIDQQETIVDISLIKNENKNKNKNKKNIIAYKQKKELDKKIRFLNKQNQIIENKIDEIETKIKKLNELLNKSNQENINDQIDYDSYNELNDLLNIELENWEKNQNEINRVVSLNSINSTKD